MAATMQGGANANALRVHLLNGHKGSDLLLIMQGKSKVNAKNPRKKKETSKQPAKALSI